MRRSWALAAAILPIAFLVCTDVSRAQTSAATALLDAYLHGGFDDAVAQLKRTDRFDRLLDDLKTAGPSWIEAGGEHGRARRELAAATLALEAARIDQGREWKYYEQAPAYLPCDWADPKPPAIVLTWNAPPLLIKWGAALLMKDKKPRPIERLWHQAAIAVGQRAEDFEFMRADSIRCRYNPEVDIDYLFHVRTRFPSEPRFQLAEAIAFEARGTPPPKGVYTFEQLENDPVVGAEATLRLGVARMRTREDDKAVTLFDRVESKTRDPWLIYLARYFKGQAQERRTRLPDAEAAYRGALATVPAAQSASIALATLLFIQDRRTESAAVLQQMFAVQPPPVDPWRGYTAADDRFWPELIARLRAEVVK